MKDDAHLKEKLSYEFAGILRHGYQNQSAESRKVDGDRADTGCDCLCDVYKDQGAATVLPNREFYKRAVPPGTENPDNFLSVVSDLRDIRQ